jgi:hypothetical protein
MSYTLWLSAEEIEERLIKVADLAIHHATYTEPNPDTDTFGYIQVILEHFIEDGSEIKFRAPVDCTNVTRLQVQHIDKESKQTAYKMFAFADANGNDVGEVNNLFAANAIVKVVLDLNNGLGIDGVDGAAFVQNADTNAYLEDRLKDTVKASHDPNNEGKVLTINAEGKVVPDDINAFYTDEETTNPSTVPLNADTLGGNPASYFAAKTDLSQFATKEDLNNTSGVVSINGKTGAVTLNASDVKAMPLSGGTATGPITFNGIILKEGVDYGPSLPSTAQVGQIFFLEVDE